MNFLQRLNPSNASLPSAARPVSRALYGGSVHDADAGVTVIGANAAPMGPGARTGEAVHPQQAHAADAPRLARSSPSPNPWAMAPQPEAATEAEAEAEAVVRGPARNRHEPALPDAAPRAEARLPNRPVPTRAAPVSVDLAEAQAPKALPLRPRPAARSTPLSELARAARPAMPASPRPVVQVHIDRIDVRVPAIPSPAAPARRAPAEPATSLADYLRRGGDAKAAR